MAENSAGNLILIQLLLIPSGRREPDCVFGDSDFFGIEKNLFSRN
jgi:hypothetical protein